MKIQVNIFLIILLLTLVTCLDATIYYVCDCTNGSDTDCVQGQDDFGGSINQPFQSTTQANQIFNTFSAGDSLQFCSGGAWETSTNLRWVNSSCQHDNVCTITSYIPNWASGDEAKPILTFQNGSHGFNLSDSGNAEHEEGYLIENLELIGSNGGNGVFIANDVDDVVLSNLSISQFNIGVHLGSSNTCNIIDNECDAQNYRITLKDSTITSNLIQGWLGASNDTQLINNYFSHNGSRAVFDHNIYISASSHEVTDGIIVSGNQLYKNTLDEQGLCSAVSLVVHGEHNNLTIQNNTIWEDVGFAQPGCWGIAVDNGYSDAEGFTNILIQNNTITNVGRVSIGVGACDTCIIENNVISTSQIFSIRAISAPDRSLGPGDLPLNNITVRNNSLYINNAVGGGTGIAVDTMGNNHSIVSNAIYYNGNANNFNCFDYDLPVSDYLDIDYNLCYFPNTLNVEWSNNFGTLSQWQLSSGFSQNSTESNPGFTNPALNQFRAENQNSAMINAGHLSLSSMCDHNCTPRDMQPDIGAYEWVAGDNLFTNGFE